MNNIVSLDHLHSSLSETKEKVSKMISKATTSFDDNFAKCYGLTLTGSESKEVGFEFPDFDFSFDVTANYSIPDVINTMSNSPMIRSKGYVVSYDETSGIVVHDVNGSQISLTIKDETTNEELIYTAPNHYGPIFAFNGRSGMVVPEEGDYTADMVGALPADTTIPDKTSDLTNDSGYVTASEVNSSIATAVAEIDIPTNTSELENDSGFVNETAMNEAIQSAINSLTTIGTTDLTAGSSSLSPGKLYGVYEI